MAVQTFLPLWPLSGAVFVIQFYDTAGVGFSASKDFQCVSPF